MRPSITSIEQVRERLLRWLMQGISPRRLALTLSLGFVLGCIPVIGISTALCALVAVAFGINLPAIQAANYFAMPFQLALMVPLVRIGAWMTPTLAHSHLDLTALAASPYQIMTHSSGPLLEQLAVMAGQGMLAWLLLSVPAVLLLTAGLTGVLRRVPALVANRPTE